MSYLPHFYATLTNFYTSAGLSKNRFECPVCYTVSHAALDAENRLNFASDFPFRKSSIIRMNTWRGPLPLYHLTRYTLPLAIDNIYFQFIISGSLKLNE